MKKDHWWHPHSPLRIFAFSVIATLATLIAVAFGLGWVAMFVVSLLIVLELTFSFDNAVINAKILKRMSPLWQMVFLTVGIAIAVLGMRILFPILVVAISAHLPMSAVLDLAINDPQGYAHALEEANPTIAAFGGSFLLMLCFGWMFDRTRTVDWIPMIEKPLKHIGHPIINTTILTSIILAFITILFGGEHTRDIGSAGALGVIVYLVVHGLAEAYQKRQAKKLQSIKYAVGLAGFYSFLYLEVIDASFSFDGVIGAFAITNQILLIAAGLGVGAVWVRSLTVYLVRRGTLDHYRYLEHGAHYAIGSLAITLLLGITLHIPEVISGTVGISFIGAAFIHSLLMNKHDTVKI